MAFYCDDCRALDAKGCRCADKKLKDYNSVHDGLSCSFCKKQQSEVRILIAGENAYICNECVLVSVDVLRDQLRKSIEGLEVLQKFGA